MNFNRRIGKYDSKPEEPIEPIGRGSRMLGSALTGIVGAVVTHLHQTGIMN